MIDALFERTALPNLHPALVHFPIALASVPLRFDAAVFVRSRWAPADSSAAAPWTLAAAAAGAAYAAGRVAAHGVGALPAATEATLSGSEQTIGLSAVGRHWKGFAEGRTVAHGRAQIPGSGRAALLLDGTGTIRLFSVRISPIIGGELRQRPTRRRPTSTERISSALLSMQAPAGTPAARPERGCGDAAR